jgi:NADH-quinone oxidoreductase subunit M
MVLGVIGILYGAVLAFAQTDLKRLVAYTSVSHMGFVLLGIFAWNELALQGAVIQIICHGISTGALFIIVGALQERIRTRDMERMGGIWASAPRMGGVGLLFGLASLGLPGLGNFVGEFLVLTGTYTVSIPMTAIAATGLVFATVYSLWMIQRTFFGPAVAYLKVPDLNIREMAVMAFMIAMIVWIGLYPQPIINTAKAPLNALQESAGALTSFERISYPVPTGADRDAE